MPHLPEESKAVSRLVIAGLLLAALEYFRKLSLPHPSGAEVVEALGTSRSQAYEHRQRILEILPSLERSRGRPNEPTTIPSEDTGALSREVVEFMFEHPGCVASRGNKKWYSDAFRVFIIELRARHLELDLLSFSEAVVVPLGTIEDWQRCGVRAPASPDASTKISATIPEIETVIDAWREWNGTFTEFCRHTKENLRLPYGAGWIASILHAHGERRQNRRNPHAIDAEAIRGAFDTFFPGAQWVGDGKQLKLRINDQVFRFNLELNVDADSGAYVGMSLRDEEDAKAVALAFEDGVRETGSPPIALLLDNRPSNHVDAVDDALGDTLRIRATPFRPENKAHCEGAFGLFSQVAPELEIDASTQRQFAYQIIVLIVTIWGRASNHLPRADREGRSRVDLYREANPSPEQIAEARAQLRERMQKQELARQRARARHDPLLRETLEKAFARLALADPDEHFRAAIAIHPLDAILAGIAIFEGKKTACTLPEGVDARYLLGIVKNVAQDNEAAAIAEVLLRERIAARDRALIPRKAELTAIQNLTDPVAGLLNALLKSDRTIDRLFFSDALAEHIAHKPDREAPGLLRHVARRIHATYRIKHRDRLNLARRIIEKVIRVE
jgi:hypothetical protein